MRPPQETKDNIIAILHSKDLIMLDPDDQTPIRVADAATLKARAFHGDKAVSGLVERAFTRVTPRPSVEVAEAEPGLNGRSLRYPRGKTLGGSSSINGMIYMRGQARDYERWAELTGDDAWR